MQSASVMIVKNWTVHYEMFSFFFFFSLLGLYQCLHQRLHCPSRPLKLIFQQLDKETMLAWVRGKRICNFVVDKKSFLDQDLWILESFVGGLWFRVVRNIRAAGNETRRYRGSEQTIEVDKERRREIIHSELAYVLNIAKYFLFLISRISKKDQRYLSIEH